MIFHLGKYIQAACNSAYWPALARGVMPGVEHAKALAGLNVGSVLDVGANKGQFSLVARALFPNVPIFAFDPLESEFKKFRSVVKGPITQYAIALGAEATETAFYVTSRADSSSLYKPRRDHEELNGVTLKSSRTVKVMRLADVFDPAELTPPILLKLDVQGAELDVLKGASELLPLVDSIYCEASFVPLYEQQPLVDEVIVFLAAYGFTLRGVFNQHVDPTVGPTQADFLFMNSRSKAALRTDGR